jgi:hypothetical protein
MTALLTLVELVVIVLALACMPAMVYGIYAGAQRRNGIELPAFGDIIAVAWDAAVPVLRGLWWGVGVAGWLSVRILAPRRAGSPPSWPYVTTAADPPQDEAETAGLSGLSAPSEASEAVEPDITPGDRAALVEALVRSGWSVGQGRAVLKGDNGAIGLEFKAAQDRLDVPAPRRVVTIRNGVDGEVEL